MAAVLGIHDGHNASAIYLEDGRIVTGLQEERITRVKNQGDVPHLSVEAIRKQTNLPLDQVVVALNGRYMRYGEWQREQVLAGYRRAGTLANRLKQPLKGTAVDRWYQRRLAAARTERLCSLGFAPHQLHPVEHHMAHAAAAYYGSGWLTGKVLVLTCDGSGDRLSATVNVGENGQLHRVAEVPEHDSIGRLYATVTYYLGMLPLEHEYKVMGLAPYVGDPQKAREQAKRFAQLFRFTENPMVWQRAPGVPSTFAVFGFLDKLLGGTRFDLIAAGLQQFSEDLLSQWVRNCVQATGIRRVVCGGGVFMNVKANLAVLDLDEVDELFVFPSCGDETNSLGAAYYVTAQQQLRAKQAVSIPPLGTMYWGPVLGDTEAEAALKPLVDQGSIGCHYADDIERVVAEAVAAGNVVARAKGPMEFGARALGNRSILARPDRPEVVRVINDMIKCRDFWMPFAPSVLADRADEYYVKPKLMPAPYMIMAFRSRPEARHKYPAAQHPYDYTCRPHEVFPADNPEFYRLLKHYESITGEGIVLNTSFNIHGEPIVRSAEDALSVFIRSGLQRLALGNWWVYKR